MEGNDISYKATDGEEIGQATPTQKIPPKRNTENGSKFISSINSYNKEKTKLSRNKETLLISESTQHQKYSNVSTQNQYSIHFNSENSLKSNVLPDKLLASVAFSPSKLIEGSKQIAQILKPSLQANDSIQMIIKNKPTSNDYDFSLKLKNQRLFSPEKKKEEGVIQIVNQSPKGGTEKVPNKNVMSLDLNEKRQLVSSGTQNYAPKVYQVDLEEEEDNFKYRLESSYPPSQSALLKHELALENVHLETSSFNISSQINESIKVKSITSPVFKGKTLTLKDSLSYEISPKMTQNLNDLDPKFVIIPQRTRSNNEDSETSSIFNENIIKETFERRNNKKQFIQNVASPKDSDDSNTPKKTLQNYEQVMMQQIKDNGGQGLLLELNLRLANLKEVQDKIFIQNPHLRCVDLRNNRITALPDNICELKQLWKLKVDYNYLTELPFYIGNIKSLEYLSASQNKLVRVPFSLFKIKGKLQLLHLNDNKLTSLPLEMGNLENLKSLLLHNNFIQALPHTMRELQFLNELGLDWFQYISIFKSTLKIAKADSGIQTIRDFLQFCSVFDTAKKELDDKGQLHFLHYIIYVMNFKEAKDLQYLKYKHKNRGILHMMAINGHQYLLQDIIRFCESIDINMEDEEGNTPLLLSIKHKRIETIKFLLKNPKTNINKSSKKYGHPLHMAIQSQEYKLAMKFLKYQFNHPSKQLDVNSKNEDGNNSMHYLLLNFYQNPQQSKSLAKMLIKRGINVNLKNKNSLSPLHLAILNNQIDAIKFALEYNKQIRSSKMGQYLKSFQQHSSIFFDFNLKGGMQQWNTLHFAIQSSNLRTIMLLLQSEEQLNFLALDEDGKRPRDLTAYNSPIYKLVHKYEQCHMKSNYEDEQSSPPGLKQNFNHFQLNLKNLHSPSKIRIKLIESAKFHAKPTRTKKSISTNHRKQFSGHYQSNAPDFHSHKQNQQFSSPKGKTFHSNKMYTTLQKKNQTLNDSDEGIDQSDMSPLAFCRAEKLLNSVKSQDRIMNCEKILEDLATIKFFSPTHPNDSCKDLQFYNRQNVKSFAIIQSDFFPYTNDQFKMSVIGHKPIINTNVSSPNDSMEHISTDQKEENLLQTSRAPIANNQKAKHIQICQEIINIRETQDSVMKDNFGDEEDDANVPEDENDHVNESQLERPKSQIRVLNKSSSVCNMEINAEREKIKLALKILKNINSLKQSLQTQEDLQQRAQSSLSNPTFTTPYQQTQTLMSEYPQEGEVSIINAIKDDSIGINQPRQDNFSPRFATALSKFSDLKNRLNEEAFDMHSAKTFSVVGQFFRHVIKLRGSQQKRGASDQDTFQNLLAYDQLSIMFFIDRAYYKVHIANISQMCKLLENSMSTSMMANKSFSKSIKAFYQYELVNTIRGLMVTTQYRASTLQKTEPINEASPRKSHKHMILSGPNVKVTLSKTPSVSVLQLLKGSSTYNSTEKIRLHLDYSDQASTFHHPPNSMKSQKCKAIKLNQKFPEVNDYSVQIAQTQEVQDSLDKGSYSIQDFQSSKKKSMKQYLSVNCQSGSKTEQKAQKHSVGPISNSKQSSIIIYEPSDKLRLSNTISQDTLDKSHHEAIQKIQKNSDIIKTKLLEIKSNFTEGKQSRDSIQQRSILDNKKNPSQYQINQRQSQMTVIQQKFSKYLAEQNQLGESDNEDQDSTLKRSIISNPNFHQMSRNEILQLGATVSQAEKMEQREKEERAKEEKDWKKEFGPRETDPMNGPASINYFQYKPNYQIAHSISNNNLKIELFININQNINSGTSKPNPENPRRFQNKQAEQKVKKDSKNETRSSMVKEPSSLRSSSNKKMFSKVVGAKEGRIESEYYLTKPSKHVNDIPLIGKAPYKDQKKKVFQSKHSLQTEKKKVEEKVVFVDLDSESGISNGETMQKGKSKYLNTQKITC